MSGMVRANRALFLLGFIVVTFTITAQTQLGGGAVIEGIVRFKQGPVPGAVVTAVNAATSKTAKVITEVNGQYILKVADTGTYHVTVDMSGFSAESADVEVMDASKPVQKDFGLSLLTEVQRAANETRARSAPARSAANGGGRGNTPDETEAETPADQPDQNPFAELQANPSAALPGMTTDAATESVAVTGNTATPQFGGAFDPRQLNLLDIPANFDQATGGPGGGGNAGAPGGGRGANDFATAFGGGGFGGGGGRGGGGRGGRGGG